jgi:hypothetical protein
MLSCFCCLCLGRWLWFLIYSVAVLVLSVSTAVICGILSCSAIMRNKNMFYWTWSICSTNLSCVVSNLMCTGFFHDWFVINVSNDYRDLNMLLSVIAAIIIVSCLLSIYFLITSILYDRYGYYQ